MKKLVILGLVFIGLFLPTFLVKADVNPRHNGIPPLKTEDVNSVQVNQLAGGSRISQINDGYEEVIIRKVINWINKSRPAKEVTEFKSYKSPVKLKVTMNNGDIAIIEPIFNCKTENGGKTCTIVDGEILIYTK